MEDRFTTGFVSGVLGGIVSFIISFGSFSLGLNTLVWADFMGTFIMDKKPEGFIEMLFFIGVQFAFLGILGAIFAFIIPYISSKYIAFKGAMYGATIWFVLLSLPNLFQDPIIEEIIFKTVVFNLLSAFFWGLALGMILKRMGSRIDN